MGYDRIFVQMEELTKRQKKILRYLVISYIDSTIPVGSKNLVEKYCLDCSPATVRNELADLEKMGYIEQPHTSAGRIPTDKGYRFYVNNLLRQQRIPSYDQLFINERMRRAGGEVKRILEEASRLLGKISNELGVVLTPWMEWGIFDHLELVELSEKKILAVIHIRSRLPKTVILELDSDFKNKDLRAAESILNERLTGLTLREIRNSIKDRVKDVEINTRTILGKITESSEKLFKFSDPEVITAGTKNILNQPEFVDRELLLKIFGLIDDKKDLMHVFLKDVDGTEIRIGRENNDSRLESFTVIASSYRRGKDIGTFGIIGPKRMPYRKILPLVETMATTISRYLS